MGQSLPQVSPPTDAFERRARGEDEEKATEAEDEDEDAVESVVSQRNGEYSATSNCCLRPRSPSHRSTSCSNCHIPSQSSSSANHPCANLRLISLVVSPWTTPSTGGSSCGSSSCSPLSALNRFVMVRVFSAGLASFFWHRLP